jgi:hypothetical protein
MALDDESLGVMMTLAGGEGGVDGANLDVGVCDARVGDVGLKLSRDTRVGGTSTTGSTWRGLGGGVGRVEPESVGVVVIPEGHNEGHAGRQGLTHSRKASLCEETGIVTEGSLLGGAVVSSDGVTGNASNGGRWVGDDLATLDVEALDLSEWVTDELSDDSEWRRRVNGQALSVEVSDTLAIRVEVTSIGIAGSGVSVARVGSSAVVRLTLHLGEPFAWVRSESIRNRVCLPDIHLGAARTVVANTSIWVIAGWRPAFDVAL